MKSLLASAGVCALLVISVNNAQAKVLRGPVDSVAEKERLEELVKKNAVVSKVLKPNCFF